MKHYQNRGSRTEAPQSSDQLENPFTRILANLVVRVRGAYGAALVDHEGETVDCAGPADRFLVRVAAAQWRIALETSQRRLSPRLGRVLSLEARAPRSSFLVQGLPDEYALVLLFHRGAPWGTARRPLAACSFLLGKEAGWPKLPLPGWWALDVISGPSGQPSAVGGKECSQPLVVLGRYHTGLRWRERGWRVRFRGGIEAMLVREPGGFWYADERPDGI